ncbi:MAG: translation elongation factor-like protein [Candidatus Eisenbacteria bacterium]|nr:translation elongation factor-like protein [Candidatus Eisenbacteria bacterium]
MADEVEIGQVTHYFGHVQVAAIKLTDGDLAVGDTIHIKGHTSDFQQKVSSMQIDREDISRAEKGQEVGIRVDEQAREGDTVFKVSQ